MGVPGGGAGRPVTPRAGAADTETDSSFQMSFGGEELVLQADFKLRKPLTVSWVSSGMHAKYGEAAVGMLLQDLLQESSDLHQWCLVRGRAVFEGARAPFVEDYGHVHVVNPQLATSREGAPSEAFTELRLIS